MLQSHFCLSSRLLFFQKLHIQRFNHLMQLFHLIRFAAFFLVRLRRLRILKSFELRLQDFVLQFELHDHLDELIVSVGRVRAAILLHEISIAVALRFISFKSEFKFSSIWSSTSDINIVKRSVLIILVVEELEISRSRAKSRTGDLSAHASFAKLLWLLGLSQLSWTKKDMSRARD
ncbi:hypothetical protein ACFX13_041794 [Malus domestica]